MVPYIPKTSGTPHSFQRHDRSLACLLNRFVHAQVKEIFRGPLDSPHKGPVTRKMLPFDYVRMARDCVSMARE